MSDRTDYGPAQGSAGIDLPALESWLDREVPEPRAASLSATLIAGGKSNLTYRISDGVSAWALRRPPLGHVLPTAHDMAREYRVIRALQDTRVPVAQPVAFCADTAVIGAPFYVMAFVDGLVLDTTESVGSLTPDHARTTGEHLVDTLAALHDVDPASVGLQDFGRPLGFLDRQLKRWHAQWLASETRPLASLEQTVSVLHENIPTSSRASIVHGDYRAANAIFHRDLSGIAAVIDWEMATLGDPMTDVGLLVVYHSLAAEGGFGLAPMTQDAGFLMTDALVQRYTERTEAATADLSWYVAFGYFKLAVISETIRHRHLAGQTLGSGFDDVGDSVPALLNAALRSLTEAHI